MYMDKYLYLPHFNFVDPVNQCPSIEPRMPGAASKCVNG